MHMIHTIPASSSYNGLRVYHLQPEYVWSRQSISKFRLFFQLHKQHHNREYFLFVNNVNMFLNSDSVKESKSHVLNSCLKSFKFMACMILGRFNIPNPSSEVASQRLPPFSRARDVMLMRPLAIGLTATVRWYSALEIVRTPLLLFGFIGEGWSFVGIIWLIRFNLARWRQVRWLTTQTSMLPGPLGRFSQCFVGQ